LKLSGYFLFGSLFIRLIISSSISNQKKQKKSFFPRHMGPYICTDLCFLTIDMEQVHCVVYVFACQFSLILCMPQRDGQVELTSLIYQDAANTTPACNQSPIPVLTRTNVEQLH